MTGELGRRGFAAVLRRLVDGAALPFCTLAPIRSDAPWQSDRLRRC